MNGLTFKQKAFIEEYFKDFNGTRAARCAGYGGGDNALAAAASRLLRSVKISKYVSARFAARCMTADECLARLAEQARGNIAEFITDTGAIDWDVVREKGHLVKKITHRAGQHSAIELYDAQGALALIGKSHALFRERYEHTGPDGGPVPIRITEVVVRMPVEGE